MKAVLVSVLVSAGLMVAFAADPVTVSTTAELVDALNTYNGQSQVIQLTAGDYVLPTEPMYVDASNGNAALSLNKVSLVGLGESPEDVKLIGDYTLRGVWIAGGGWLKNLMITNCFSNKRGGGVYGGNITNCVIAGCEATHGGAVASATKLLDSRLLGNTASYGGAVFGTSFSGCKLEKNVATQQGGGAWFNGSYAVSDSQFVGNRSAKHAGGVWQQGNTATISNCLLSGNAAGASSYGGAGYANLGARLVFTDCTITNNTAQMGGGIYDSSAYDCRIVGNLADGSHGGGVYASSSSVVISNCLIHANRCVSSSNHAYGGGIYCSSTGARIIDCEVAGNYAKTGEEASANKFGLTGGVHQGTIIGGSIHDNYADNDGGGCRQGVAIGCRIYNNDSGGKVGKNCHTMQLIGCDIADNLVSYGSALDCVFHDIVSGAEHTLTNNPFMSNHTYSSVLAVWTYYPNATNCLFRNNGTTMFMGTTAGGVKSSLVNCTIADNVVGTTFHTFKDVANKLVVANCAFVGNKTASGTANDVSMSLTNDDSGDPGIDMTYCVYGRATIDLAGYSSVPTTLYQLGANGLASSPRFNADGDWPYEPRCSSPLVGRGVFMDWMTDAYDIRGDIADGKYRRLRDGKVDIGCYQCWLDPVGMMLMVR